jgi:hypothetical protein
MFVVELVHEVGSQIVAAGALVAFQDMARAHGQKANVRVSVRSRNAAAACGSLGSARWPWPPPAGYPRTARARRAPGQPSRLTLGRVARGEWARSTPHRGYGSHAHASVIGHLSDRLGFPFVEPCRQCQLALTIVRPSPRHDRP